MYKLSNGVMIPKIGLGTWLIDDDIVEQVMVAYNDLKHIQKWNHASDNWFCPKAENNLVKGGKFSYTMAAKDGSFQFDFSGSYDVVEKPHKLNYHLDDNREVLVDFKKENHTTVVTMHFDPETSNPIEFQKQGWQAILDNFKKYCEGLK